MTNKGKPGFFYGYVMVTSSFFIMAVVWGANRTFGVFLEPMLREFGWTRAATSGAFTLVMVLMGYGVLTGTFKKDHIIINVYESLATQEKANIMAKNLCLLYLGIFNSAFDVLGIDVDGEEVECILTGGDKCSYKFDLLVDEIEDSLLDDEMSDLAVSGFLASL